MIDVSALARRDAFTRGLGIVFVEASLGRAVTRVAIEERHLNFNGVCHGGLTFTLADAAFGYACNSQGVVSGSIDAHIVYSVAVRLGEMLTATAMGFFEREIEKAVVLALFVPLIISSGGNSGSQAATLIVRALAVGDVRLRDWWHVMRRELISGALLGCILGTIGFLRIAAWSAFSTIYGPHWALVGLTVGLSLVGIVLWGALAGAMLPFVLKRLHLDPATSSAPFVATLVDVTGLVIYFSVAMTVLRGSLL